MATIATKQAATKILPWIAIGAVGFFGVGLLAAQGVATNNAIQNYGENRQLDQALAVIVMILIILVLIAAFVGFFAQRAGAKGGVAGLIGV